MAVSKSSQDAVVTVETAPELRHRLVIETARGAGLLGGEPGRIAGRVRRPLLAAAKERTGLTSDTALLEYALAKVALEDDFGSRLLERKARVPRDLDLEF